MNIELAIIEAKIKNKIEEIEDRHVHILKNYGDGERLTSIDEERLLILDEKIKLLYQILYYFDKTSLEQDIELVNNKLKSIL